MLMNWYHPCKQADRMQPAKNQTGKSKPVKAGKKDRMAAPAVMLMVMLCLLFTGFFVPETVMATTLQPIVFSPQCNRGGNESESFFQQAVDIENARKDEQPDFFKAERLYEQALSKGNAKAALFLGRIYRQNYAKIPAYSARLQFQVGLFEQAIAMGCPDGYLFLAEAYQNGWGVKASLNTAWRLVKEGAEKGSMAAMTAWGSNLYFQNRFDKAELAQTQRAEGKAWLEKALKNGYGDAGHELAMIYRMYERDPKNAIRALREGARLGNVDCLYMLAGIYRRGEDGQPKDTVYADAADELRRGIDLTATPKPIGNFSRWLPAREVMPYQVNTP